MVDRSLRVLDVQLDISCDEPQLVESFLGVFGRFSTTGQATDPVQEVRVRVDDVAGRFEDGNRRVPLAPGPIRPAHVYNLLYMTLVRSLGQVYLLHAAVVARNGKAWLVSGPAGSGKTSLGCALLERGFGFLSDDLAPLATTDGLVHPFPRRVGLVSGTSTGKGITMGSKEFVLPESFGAEMVEEPLPPGAVVLMNPYQKTGRDTPVQMSVGLLGETGDLTRRLQEATGITLQCRQPVAEVTVLDLELQGADAIKTAMETVDAADEQVLFHTRNYGTQRSYAESPSLEPISTREAALGLLRETLNREPRSALMIRHGGKHAAALFELMGLLDELPCYKLTPAGVEETADLLAKTFQ